MTNLLAVSSLGLKDFSTVYRKVPISSLTGLSRKFLINKKFTGSKLAQNVARLSTFIRSDQSLCNLLPARFEFDSFLLDNFLLKKENYPARRTSLS